MSAKTQNLNEISEARVLNHMSITDSWHPAFWRARIDCIVYFATTWCTWPNCNGSACCLLTSPSGLDHDLWFFFPQILWLEWLRACWTGLNCLHWHTCTWVVLRKYTTAMSTMPTCRYVTTFIRASSVSCFAFGFHCFRCERIQTWRLSCQTQKIRWVNGRARGQKLKPSYWSRNQPTRLRASSRWVSDSPVSVDWISIQVNQHSRIEVWTSLLTGARVTGSFYFRNRPVLVGFLTRRLVLQSTKLVFE